MGDLQITQEGVRETEPSINRKKRILVAEDNKDDFLLLRFAFEKAGLAHELVQVTSVFEAVEYFAGVPPFSDRGQHPFPDLLLLDIHMPGLNGFDLLRLMQAHRELTGVPVVVLSNSSLETDAQKARSLGAREFVTKPTGTAEYRNMVLGLHQRLLGGTAPKAVNKQ